jgi:hypothetical protein
MTAPAANLAPTPPQNLDAEESLLGALLIAGSSTGTLIERVAEEDLAASDFYRASHGHIYRAILSLYAKSEPVDSITVVDELGKTTTLDAAGGPERIHELAALVPAASNAPHYARLVVEKARLRQLITIGHDITRLGWDAPAGLDDLEDRALRLVEKIDLRTHGPELQPLWLDQALNEPIPDTAEFVDGVLETGVLADIVGLPYLHKSAVALELAVKVAKGRGMFLGRYPIKAQAKVAYYWADDSRPQELKRIQAYAQAHELAGRDVQVGFYLNPGLTLPDDLNVIKRHVRDHGYRLLVFDSLYNFADFDFVKDTGAVKHLYTTLKRLCDDVEGLTIVLVDHASKPSDSNRDRDDSISSFGSVWKAAAVRCSIVVTKKGQSLFVSATGNNVKGFPKTAAYFNQERLELALAEEKEPDPERESKLDDLVLDYIRRNPGRSTNHICRNVKGRAADIGAAVARLAAANLVYDTYQSYSQLLGRNPEELSDAPDESHSRDSGRRKPKTAWIPLDQAEKATPDHNGRNPEEPAPGQGPSEPQTSSQTSSPYVVGGGWEEPEGEPQGHSLDDAPLPEDLEQHIPF